ncbi:Immunoglobulin I-set domain protein [Sedimentisphaera cyanobacteriorum]|uniref:Immunoglobulin I-set domain protein n=1 Tax=Sedimentisphaera cyanobacteriorum TaxID=1940790 RepID=A0A1Q2HMB9_9BACT|nr:LamG-like jellyroll fold domain-containing protein [Sedimentisphaera cyanobacteriorum]AQQ08383.1 Immunoglobulin I-set domain protein [Sedimentisphaera cyanobacteriorum]
MNNIKIILALFLFLGCGLTFAATFEAVGVYDEQDMQANQVDYSMTYSDNSVWTTGIGQTLGESQVMTYEEFKVMVEEYYLDGDGGVINFDNAEMSDSASFAASFDGGQKQFTVNATGNSGASDTVQNTSSGGNRTPISGDKRLQGNTNRYEFEFSDFTGMDPQDIIAAGITVLGRDGSSDSWWRVIAYYTNGEDSGSTSTSRYINMSSGDTTEDSFSGIRAPEGYWITKLRVHCDISWTWSAADDLGFVFESSTKPYGPSVSQTAQPGGVDAVLSWQAGPDENDVYAVNPDIVDQYVFMTTGGDDPNLYYVGAAGEDPGTEDPSSEYAVSDLNYDASYQWAVVEALDGYEQSLTVGVSELEDVNENNIIGSVWSFDTLSSVPVIETQPADVLEDAGEDASISVEVSSVSPEQYLWYKSDDNSSDTPEDDVEAGSSSNTLNLDSIAVADEGYYYCVITNNGGSVTSDTANAAVKRQMAHWTFDQADYSGGQYLDVSSDDDVYYPADPNGTPAFNTGIDGDSILIDEVNSWARAGTWNPSKYSNQLTVSAWVKWDGDTSSHKGIVSKRDIWGSETMLWSLIIRNEYPGGTVRFYNSSGLSVWTSESLPIDEWTLITAVFDGSEGKVYFNGLEKASGSGSLSSGTETMIMLGAVDNPSVNEEFDPLSGSELDDVQILNYAADKFAVADMYYEVTGIKSCILDYESQLDVANTNTDLVIGQEGFEPDCVIDISDFAALAGNWLSCGLYPECE